MVIDHAKKSYAALAKKVAGTKVGKALKKIPGPVRKGWLAGALVPVPGAAEAGALGGLAVHGKDVLERKVRSATGRPWRMFDEKEDARQEQLRKDRRALAKGAVLAGGAVAGGALLLRATRGEVAKMPKVPRPPGFGDGPPGLRAPRPDLGKGMDLKPRKMPRGVNRKVVKTREVIRLRTDTPVPEKPLGGVKGAARNSARKFGPEGAVDRSVKAAGLREKRAWGAVKPAAASRLSKLKPEVREAYSRLAKQAGGARPKPVPAGTVTGKEASQALRGAREGARQDLQKFRRKHQFAEGRDRSRTIRDVGIGAGALAAGGAAIHASRKIGQATARAEEAAAAVKDAVPQFTPGAVAGAAGDAAKSRVKRVAKEYFPTFTKGGKKVARLLKKRVFAEAVRRVALREFGGREQLKDVGNHRYVDPLQSAAGLRDGYFRKDGAGTPIKESLPLGHAQVLRSAYRKGEAIKRTAGRGAALGKDVADTVRGKERGRDASGRIKKREWEKKWFRDGVKKAAVAGGVLGYYGVLRKSPKARAWHQRTTRKVAKAVNRVVPDAVPTSFSTPASRLLNFDAVAEGAGWDVRDPRGRSARVFAPGSRKRERREKKWHEEVGNERKLWKAGVVGAAGLSLAAGLLAGRKTAKIPLRKPVHGPNEVPFPKAAETAAPKAPARKVSGMPDNVTPFPKRPKRPQGS